MKPSFMEQSDTGFTLVEVLATLAISGSMLLGVANIFQSSMHTYQLSRETARSTEIGASHLEFLACLPTSASELNAGTSTVNLDHFQRTTVVTDDVPAVGAKTITVTVQRTSSNRRVKLVSVRGR